MNSAIDFLGRSGRLGGVIACATLFLLGPTAMAQEKSADGPHPAHIHTGTCDKLGEIVAPLTNVVEMTGESAGSAKAIPVKTSRSYVDLPLKEILDGGHAVNVHRSADEIKVYIACGIIGGTLEDEGDRQHLIVGLAEQNDSGHTGIVWLGSDGDRTEIVVTLIEPDDAK